MKSTADFGKSKWVCPVPAPTTARHCLRYLGLFVLDAASSDNTVTTTSAPIARTTVTISTSIPWTSIPPLSALLFDSTLCMLSLFLEDRGSQMTEGQSDKTFHVSSRDKDCCVEVSRSYQHGPGRIFGGKAGPPCPRSSSPGDVTPSGLRAKCLAAVVLAHHWFDFNQ